MALVQVGHVGIRGPDGRVIREQPIYRDLPEITETEENEGSYLPLDELAEVFAKRYKAYLDLKRLEEKERESKRKKSDLAAG